MEGMSNELLKMWTEQSAEARIYADSCAASRDSNGSAVSWSAAAIADKYHS